MKTRALMVAGVMMGVAALVACGNSGARVEPAEVLLRQAGTDDADVRALVFRDLMREHPKEDVAFISFGLTGEAWVSPPASFLARLAEPGLVLAPVSRARFPALGAVAKGGGPEVIRDRSGKPGRMYFVRIKKWLDEDSAEVDGGRVEGVVPAAGMRCVVRRVTGKTWRMEEVERW